MQAFTDEAAAAGRYGAAVEDAFEAARAAIRSRSLLTGICHHLIFGSVVAVLWVGAQNVLAGTMSAGTLGQFLLYSVIAAGSLGALSEVWGELSQAAGAAERLTELLVEVSPIAAPADPRPLPRAGRRTRHLRRRALLLSVAPRHDPPCTAFRWSSPAKPWRSSVPRAPARPRSFR